MADKSGIEWLMGEDGIQGSTWNPIRARITDEGGSVRIGWHCEHASIGCVGCYSEQTNKGFFKLGTGLPYARQSREKVELFLDERTLLQPTRWKKGRKIFPCSMTDAFADFVPDEWLDKMLAVAALSPQHEFLFLTKRAERVPAYLKDSAPLADGRVSTRFQEIFHERHYGVAVWPGWPLPNVTLGFSAENQEWFDKRWPHMREVALAGWKVNCSYEPALGPIDFGDALPLLSQVIFGGHSGPNAKPCDVQWARDTIAQCKAAGVPCFVKQLGSKPIENGDGYVPRVGIMALRNLDRKGGNPAEWPEDLRVREYPNV
jgi:protein gp37